MAVGNGEEIKFGQLKIRFLVEGATSGGSVAIFEFDVGPGAKMPVAHSHDAYEETIYGVEGVLTMTVDGNRREIKPGEALCIRRGEVHVSTISTRPKQRLSRSSPLAFSGRISSAKSGRLWQRLQEVHQTWQRWEK